MGTENGALLKHGYLIVVGKWLFKVIQVLKNISLLSQICFYLIKTRQEINCSWRILARLIGNVFRFQHRGTHWWAAPLYQKQRNRSGLNSWLDCLASWYTLHFNLRMFMKNIRLHIIVVRLHGRDIGKGQGLRWPHSTTRTQYLEGTSCESTIGNWGNSPP